MRIWVKNNAYKLDEVAFCAESRFRESRNLLLVRKVYFVSHGNYFFVLKVASVIHGDCFF